jgi:hypothetical protein
MDTTDTALGYGGVAVLAIAMIYCVSSILYQSCNGCRRKKEVLLNNGDDGVSEV